VVLVAIQSQDCGVRAVGPAQLCAAVTCNCCQCSQLARLTCQARPYSWHPHAAELTRKKSAVPCADQVAHGTAECCCMLGLSCEFLPLENLDRFTTHEHSMPFVLTGETRCSMRTRNQCITHHGNKARRGFTDSWTDIKVDTLSIEPASPMLTLQTVQQLFISQRPCQFNVVGKRAAADGQPRHTSQTPKLHLQINLLGGLLQHQHQRL